MPQLAGLGGQVFLVVGIRGKSYWDLLHDFQSVTFQANDFLGIVGQKADFSHYCRDLFAYRKLDGKLIKTSDNHFEFYDMKSDRKESRNIYNIVRLPKYTKSKADKVCAKM